MADYAADLPDEGSRKLLGTNVDGDNDSLDEDEENMVTVVVTNCKTDLVTHAALLAMGLGAWVAVNGIYNELPLIAMQAPEGYDIYSYVSVCVAAANVFPCLYGGFLCLSPPRSKFRRDSYATATILLSGVASCVALAGIWNNVSLVGGSPHLFLFLFFTFLLGGVDCLTSVLYYPLVEKFRRNDFLTALLVGEALTGGVAALLAALQSSVGTEYFSVGLYFVLLAVMMAVAFVGFLFVIRLLMEQRKFATLTRLEATGNPLTVNSDGLMRTSLVFVAGEGVDDAEASEGQGRRAPRSVVVAIVLGQFWLAVVQNGVYLNLLPKVLKYACFDASDLTAKLAFVTHFGYVISSVATLAAYPVPIGTLSGLATKALHTSVTSFSQTSVHRGLWAVVAVYIAASVVWMVWASTQSAYASTSPSTGVVLNLVLLAGVVSHAKASLFFEYPHLDLGVWAGTGIQLGSLVGAVLFFLLIVVFEVF